MIIGIITSIFLLNIQDLESESEEIFLTAEEKAWLDEHKDDIKIGHTIDYPPVEFLNNGKYAGISADYFQLLEQKLGIKIQMVQFDNFDELIKQTQSRKLTGITAATKTPERSEYLDFTIPYIDNPNVIITRKNFSGNLTFEKLVNTSMDIIVVEGYDIIEFLNAKYPRIEYKTVKSPNEGIRMVAFGEADAMIIEIMSASASIERDNISNLIVNVETPYDSSLSIATRNDWPMLNQIFNKGIAQITKHERNVIEQKWMYLQRESIFQKTYFWTAILGIVILLIIIIVISAWNSSLKLAVKEKTQALEESTKELKFKTYHDELTGLYNRVYMAELTRDLEEKSSLPFSVIVADLNGLKITNDTFGHDVGDLMLIRVSEIIKENIKPSHFACRVGGDEIVVLMPLTDEEECIGIVEDIKSSALNAEEDPIKPLVALGYATMNKNNSTSFTELLKIADDKMYANKISNNESNYNMIINSIKNHLYKNKYESRDHYKRLDKMCRQMGTNLNLGQSYMENLTLLSELHDIGKAGLDKELLLKKGPLTMEEWESVKTHPGLGFKIVSASTKFSHIGKCILAHHEHWDGSGYPQGLKGEEIPFIARLFSIVEAYDVMTNERPYKPIYSKDRAIKELEDNSGTQFDPELVKLFIDYIKNN